MAYSQDEQRVLNMMKRRDESGTPDRYEVKLIYKNAPVSFRYSVWDRATGTLYNVTKDRMGGARFSWNVWKIGNLG